MSSADTGVLWGEPVATVQSWQDFLVAELRRRNAVNATRPLQARLRFIIWTINDGSDPVPWLEPASTAS